MTAAIAGIAGIAATVAIAARAVALAPSTSPVPIQLADASASGILHEGADGAVIRRTVLPSGIRVISEQITTVRSVTIGIWAQVGSVDETPEQAGCSHYLEHLLFKGTPRRSALEISSAIDAIGGEMNAFTSKEYTCFYARVIDTDLAVAVDVLADAVLNSTIASEDVDGERQVICEEIAMRDDDPGDAIHDLFTTTVYGDSALGRPVIGSTESIRQLTRDQIYDYYRHWYTPDRLLVSVAGNVDHDQLVQLVEQAVAQAGIGGHATAVAPRSEAEVAPYVPQVAAIRRDNGQANLLLGMRGVDRHDERRFALGVLNAVLGGGMSSRLFQEIREKRGLAYSVYSFAISDVSAGLVGVYAGCSPDRLGDVVGLTRAEFTRIAQHGLGDDELTRGKGQMSGALVLSLEDTSSRMSRLAKAELTYGELLTVDEVLGRIDAVSAVDVAQIAQAVYTGEPSLVGIGPFSREELAHAL